MKNKNKGGAPDGNKNAEKPIKWDYVEKLISIGCTGQEVADVMNIHYDTLAARCKLEREMLFSELVKKHASKFKISMRRAMYRRGMVKESDTMLIWLSKNFLGMTDNLKILEDDSAISDDEFDDFMDKVRSDEE